MISQFSRWLCPKCGRSGIDSWNKAVFDGTAFEADDIPNPWVLGMECTHCLWPCVVLYSAHDVAPRAIFGPINLGDGCYAYETKAFEDICWPEAGEVLLASREMDADWSGGCLAAKGQMQ